ncbi:hypothetical protein Rumeso_01126 [Rubellimicrobium mesophilum DSM 19309]|uniref:Uncharacterized protein n=1 Tax=Rubellimicrobium mesophilum DSM 19309 TaxID=442562 RepID=A0A017HSB9_9RHOB|nr:hypothetical protein Rumeso_01126 [Rubellimicrobium mesophilum DSM 19309]
MSLLGGILRDPVIGPPTRHGGRGGFERGAARAGEGRPARSHSDGQRSADGHESRASTSSMRGQRLERSSERRDRRRLGREPPARTSMPCRRPTGRDRRPVRGCAQPPRTDICHPRAPGRGRRPQRLVPP